MMNRRLESIKQYIARHREVKLSQLEELLPDVSSMTLRRDLAQLERQGYVVRFRGSWLHSGRRSLRQELLYVGVET
ncbi:MAG: DeoR/GlpR transcriptional regulator [Clostridia bacterium]|nr:DeoR/GlpR transcriptional regulator [Clostridia bacterium]